MRSDTPPRLPLPYALPDDTPRPTRHDGNQLLWRHPAACPDPPAHAFPDNNRRGRVPSPTPAPGTPAAAAAALSNATASRDQHPRRSRRRRRRRTNSRRRSHGRSSHQLPPQQPRQEQPPTSAAAATAARTKISGNGVPRSTRCHNIQNPTNNPYFASQRACPWLNHCTSARLGLVFFMFKMRYLLQDLLPPRPTQ